MKKVLRALMFWRWFKKKDTVLTPERLQKIADRAQEEEWQEWDTQQERQRKQECEQAWKAWNKDK